MVQRDTHLNDRGCRGAAAYRCSGSCCLACPAGQVGAPPIPGRIGTRWYPAALDGPGTAAYRGVFPPAGWLGLADDLLLLQDHDFVGCCRVLLVFRPGRQDQLEHARGVSLCRRGSWKKSL